MLSHFILNINLVRKCDEIINGSFKSNFRRVFPENLEVSATLWRFSTFRIWADHVAQVTIRRTAKIECFI